MKYELQALEELVIKELDPQYVFNQSDKKKYLEEKTSAIEIELSRITEALVEESFNCQDQAVIERYIQRHQIGLIRVLDAHFNYLKGLGNVNSIANLKLIRFKSEYQAIQLLLESFLGIFFSSFRFFLDKDCKIADCVRRQKTADAGNMINQVVSKFETNKIDKELTELVLIPFRYFADLDNTISENDLRYLNFYNKHFEQFLLKPIVEQKEVCLLCIKLNLNTPAFSFYYIGLLKDERPAGLKEQIEYFYQQLKIINQIIGKEKISYDQTLPSLSDQLTSWIAEEIYFLEKKLSFEPPYSESPTVETTAPKLKTNLSVSQLTLGIKLLLDTGIIQNKNASEIRRMVARSFRTDKQEIISENTLLNKSYSIEHSAIEGVKGAIVGLLNEVRKY